MQFQIRPINEQQFIGYNDNLPLQDLVPGQFVKADNVLLSDNRIKKVTGSTAVAASIASQTFQGLATLEVPASSLKYIVATVNGASNASWYSWSGSGNFSLISGSNVLANSTPFFFETANSILFGFNGTEEADWDGTTFTHNRSGVPKGFYPVWFHNYLFVARTTAQPNRLFWSNLGDPTTFSGSNFVDINPGDGDQIMGLGVINDELVVFKRNTIWSITGFSGTTFSATTINTQNTNNRIIGYGCIAPGSIVPTGNDLYFLSFLGNVPHIRSLKKTQFATTLGGGIESLDIATTMNSINLNALNAIQGIYDGRYIYWAIPTGNATTPNQVLVFDTYNVQKMRGKTIYPWTTRSGINPTYFTTSTISGTEKVYFSDQSTTGLVFKFDNSVYTNNGVNITMDVVSRGYMHDPARKMKWKYLYMKYDTGVNSTLTVNAQIDNQGFVSQSNINLSSMGGFLLDTSLLDAGILGGGTSSTTRVDLSSLTGKICQVEFTESSANAVQLYDYQLYPFPKPLRAS